MELVTGARQAAQPHPLEAVMGFQVGKAHLDLLAFIAGSGEGLGAGQGSSLIARRFMHIAWDFA